MSTFTNIDFAHQLLARVEIEIRPGNHAKHIHFVLLIFLPQLGKLNANKRKLSVMVGTMEPFWKIINTLYIEFPGKKGIVVSLYCVTVMSKRR